MYLSNQKRLLSYTAILFAAFSMIIYDGIQRDCPFDYALELVANGLDQPVQVIWNSDNPRRLFIVGRQGDIQIMVDGLLQELPFLDISDQVSSSGIEQGLLSAAFHADFAQNGVFYIHYTSQDGSIVVARYHTLPDNREMADPKSAVVLLTIPKRSVYHHGGTLLFGPDGYLYVSIGDDAQFELHDLSPAQELDNYLGKILRLDVSDLNVPYRIPIDNPFLSTPNALPEIWAYGLRNPWRMAFDSQSGGLFIPDVGSSAREEVNFQPAGGGAGANYGWPWFEGNRANKTEGLDAVDSSNFVFPITEYERNTSGGCAIIGGEVYYGNSLPQVQGKYLFGDYCYGYIWALEVMEDGRGQVETLMRDPGLHLSAFTVDRQGEIYMLDFGKGTMFKLVERKVGIGSLEVSCASLPSGANDN